MILETLESSQTVAIRDTTADAKYFYFMNGLLISFQLGQHSKDEKNLLQGQRLQEAYPAQGYSVQGRQGTRDRTDKLDMH
jgi:hypothetical protein